MASPAPRYARAFAEVANSAGLDPDAALQQMQDFIDTLAGSADLREFLGNPSIEMAQKLRVLDSLVPRMGLAQQVRNFIAVLIEHHRLAEFHEVLTCYREIADERSGAVEAKITSAHPLNPADRTEMETQIAKLAGAHVRATYAEDPSLLGGAVIEIGSTIYDGSVRAQLQQLRQKLVNA